MTPYPCRLLDMLSVACHALQSMLTIAVRAAQLTVTLARMQRHSTDSPAATLRPWAVPNMPKVRIALGKCWSPCIRVKTTRVRSPREMQGRDSGMAHSENIFYCRTFRPLYIHYNFHAVEPGIGLLEAWSLQSMSIACSVLSVNRTELPMVCGCARVSEEIRPGGAWSLIASFCFFCSLLPSLICYIPNPCICRARHTFG